MWRGSLMTCDICGETLHRHARYFVIGMDPDMQARGFICIDMKACLVRGDRRRDQTYKDDVAEELALRQQSAVGGE